MIGRKTGPQVSSRPPRGGRGRGRGRGRGGISDTNRAANTDNIKPGPNSGESLGSGVTRSPSVPVDQASSPRKSAPQREGSGSPRRGAGRGHGGYSRRSNSNPGGNSSSKPTSTGEKEKEG